MYQEKSGNPDGEALGLNGLVRLEESADLWIDRNQTHNKVEQKSSKKVQLLCTYIPKKANRKVFSRS
jgi:hypothetical protein